MMAEEACLHKTVHGRQEGAEQHCRYCINFKELTKQSVNSCVARIT